MAQVMDAKIGLPSSALGGGMKEGSYTTMSINVKKSDASRPPAKLYVVTPVEKGTYPVLLFLHGFCLTNSWYSNLLAQIASYGYIVVAPQIYGLLTFWTSVSKEVKVALEVARWISSSGGLPAVLPEKVYRDETKLALAGHSRGGKAAFTLALANAASSNANDPTFKALVGIDPSAGMFVSCRIPPKIFEYVPRSLEMSVPVAIIGAGLSNQWLCMCPPFAGNGVNHSEFFNESKPPACYFLAKDYGHCDMMDDRVARVASFVMKSGKGSRELMRKSIAMVVAAVLEAYLDGEEGDLKVIVYDPSLAPITLDPVIYVKDDGSND